MDYINYSAPECFFLTKIDHPTEWTPGDLFFLKKSQFKISCLDIEINVIFNNINIKYGPCSCSTKFEIWFAYTLGPALRQEFSLNRSLSYMRRYIRKKNCV